MMQQFKQEMVNIWRSVPKGIAALFAAVLAFAVGSAVFMSNYAAADAAKAIFTLFCLPIFICVEADMMLRGVGTVIAAHWDVVMQLGIAAGFVSYWLLPESGKKFAFCLPVIAYCVGAAYWQQLCPQMVDTSFYQQIEKLCLLCVFPSLFGIIAARVLKFTMNKLNLSASAGMIVMCVVTLLMILASAADILTFERYLYLFAYGWFILLPAPFVYGAAKVIHKI